MADDLFLIEKRGLYYRPESRGYTGLKHEAGRYSFDDAAQIVGPNGPDGPQDGMVIWRESEAPEYSQSCAWDVRMKDEAYRKGCADAADLARVQVAAAYDDAATFVDDGYVCTSCGAVFKGKDGHTDENCTYKYASWDKAPHPQIAQAIRNRTPDDAAAALDALLEKAVKAALEEAALYAEDGFCCRRCGAAFVGRVGHYDEDCPYNDAHWNSLDDEHRADAIRAIDPATIVQKVKA